MSKRYSSSSHIHKRYTLNSVADASGKFPSGILEGTVMDFGAFDQCLRIRVNDSQGQESFRGQYCMVGYQSPLLYPVNEKTAQGSSYLDAHGTPPEWANEVLEKGAGYLKRVAFWFGTCIPSTCSEEDVQKICQVVSKPLGFKVTTNGCQVEEPFEWPSYALGAVCFLGVIVGICILGTLLDLMQRWFGDGSSTSEDEYVLLRVTKAFSVLSNTEKLFGQSSGGCLSCFSGIRFLSATWIILGHHYFYTDTWKYLKYRHLLGVQEYFNHKLPAAVIDNFTVPVGSFFFMSGFLLVYTTWKKLEKSDGKMNLFMFFIHKYWRMTPALGLTLALFMAMPLIDSGPIWKSTIEPPLKVCREFWWGNILYINNWWNTDEFCLLHSWYLAALMQFHMVGIVLLILFYRWPVVGIVSGLLIVAGCCAVTAMLTVWYDFPMPAPGIIRDMDVIENYFSRIYVKPFAHIATYVIGMVFAFVFMRNRNKKLSTKYQILGWTLATASAMTSVYGVYGTAEDAALRAFYIVGHRFGWALGVGWLVYACASGCGGKVNRFLSWNAFYPLGQLSYLTYLIHPLVIIYRSASLRERVYYGHSDMVFSYLSTVVVSLFLAFVGYIAVETPFIILEGIVFKTRSRSSMKVTKKVEDEKEDDRIIATRSIKTISA
ncbi:nose resistant to fluoxetine protein 6-like [Uloborus diversus]|uniref:nose resistant to fluoxetine protein 6-like n=1 Tax=Uloborus diversus TaxID=327109 RepID=UPI00240A961C|nr:nose resistant to fluoxetine protein 6-like [Uloborus diversus]